MHESMGFNVPLALPPGYRFIPTDEELIGYLKKKVANTRLRCHAIHDVDIYSYTPDQLANEYMGVNEDACYFFTPTSKKYEKGSVVNRVAAGGTWKATNVVEDIYKYKDGRKWQLIGRKKSFEYRNGKKVKTRWLMKEYRLDPDQVHPQMGDWVICKIYKSNRKTDANEEVSADHKNKGWSSSVNHHLTLINDHLSKEEDQVLKDDDHPGLQRYYNEFLGVISHN